jgi:hypothetical protein
MGLLLPQNKFSLQVNKKVLIVCSLISVVFIQIYVVHTILISHSQRIIAQKIYPFDKQNLKILITQSQENNDGKSLLVYLEQYERYFHANYEDYEYLGDIYKTLRLYRYQLKALSLYEESFVWGSYNGEIVTRVVKLYELKKQFEGERNAQLFVNSLIFKYEKMMYIDPPSVSLLTTPTQDLKNIYQQK